MPIGSLISRLSLRKSAPLRRLSTASGNETLAAKPSNERSLLFNKVVRSSSKSSIGDTLNKWLDKGYRVKKTDISDLMCYFRNQKKFLAALQLYEWMDNSKLKMNNGDQAIRIDLLFKTEGVASAERYFDSLDVSEKTEKTYGALLSCYRRERIIDKAVEIFERMKVLNYGSTLNYNNLLSLYHSMEQPEKVLSLVQEMEEENIAINLHTYNLLINSYASLKDFHAMEAVLKKMESSNTKPDLFTYGNLATIYFNSGLREEACTVLGMMEKMEIQHDRGAFEACCTRIKLHSMMNDLSGVNRAWEALKTAFPTPPNTGYLFMLFALSKMGSKENLEKIFGEWEAGCSAYDFRLPNVLLEYYLNHDMIEEATFLYKRLEKKGRKPNLRGLNSFTNLCIKNREIDLAIKYLEMGFDHGEARKSKWFPTDETIKLVVDYFEANNDTDRAERFIQSMKKHDRLDSNSLLSNFKAPNAGA